MLSADDVAALQSARHPDPFAVLGPLVLTNVLCGRLNQMSSGRVLFKLFTPAERAMAIRALDRLGRRNVQGEQAAFAELGLHPQRAAHELAQIARDGESQTGASVRLGDLVAALAERLENPGEHVRRDSHAIVFDFHLHGGGAGPCAASIS